MSRTPSRVVKLCISLLVLASDVLGRWFRRGQTPGMCVVLYYHAIRPEMRAAFARQMDTLLRISTPVSVAGDFAGKGSRLATAVTFDDAFVSVINNALPELRARRIPCHIFVPTGSIGKRPTWLEAGHSDAGESVAAESTLREFASDPLVSMGSHSSTHANFRRLDDATALRELVESRQELERIIEKAVTTFSFPHGAYKASSPELARAAGYTRVFTIEPTPHVAGPDRLLVGRVRVDPDDWSLEFALKARGAYRWMARVSELKRRVRGPGAESPSYSSASA